MNLNLLVAVERKANPQSRIKVGQYFCKASQQNVVTNYSLAPWSPWSGRSLRPATSITRQLPLQEIRAQLAKIGRCTTCETQHYAFASTIPAFGRSIHCVICNNPIKVDTDATARQSEQSDQEIIAAGDDNDNNDSDILGGDDDNDNNDDNGDNDNNNNDAANTDTTMPPAAAPSPGEPGITAPGNTEPVANNPPAAQPRNANPSPAGGSQTDQPDNLSNQQNNFSGDDDDDNNNNDNDDDDKSTDLHELVSSTAKKIVIDCFARNGGLADKPVTLVSANDELILVLAGEVPVMTLKARAAGDNAKLFAEPDKLSRAFAAIIEDNPGAVRDASAFAKLGGKPIKFTVPVDAAVQERITQGVRAVTTAAASDRVAVQQDLQQAISIASLIVAKNIDRDTSNPLYDNLVAKLREVGVRNAEDIGNKILATSIDPFIRIIMTKANELLEKPREAREEMAKFVNKIDYRQPQTAEQQHRQQFATASVPISTATEILPPESPENNFGRVITAGSKNPQVENMRGILRR